MMAPSPRPPQTQAIEHIKPQTRAIARARLEIGSEIAWLGLVTLTLESSPQRAAAAPPLRPEGI